MNEPQLQFEWDDEKAKLNERRHKSAFKKQNPHLMTRMPISIMIPLTLKRSTATY